MAQTTAQNRSAFKNFSQKIEDKKISTIVDYGFKKITVIVALVSLYVIILTYSLNNISIIQSFGASLSPYYVYLAYDIPYFLKRKVPAHIAKLTQKPTPKSTPSITPEPTKKFSLYSPVTKKRFYLSSGKSIEIDVSDIESQNGPVHEIIDLNPSPDEKKVIVLTKEQIDFYGLYYSKIEPENFIFIGYVESAQWSHNSRYIAYIWYPAGVGPGTLGIYDSEKDESVNLSHILDIGEEYDILSFRNARWTMDDLGIIVEYGAIEFDVDNPDPGIAVYGRLIKEGVAIIPFNHD